MHLSEHARMGHALPTSLPPELIPTKSRSGSITSPPPNSGPGKICSVSSHVMVCFELRMGGT